MTESTHVFYCNGFDPVCTICSQDAALEFAKARAREIYGANARVERINLEEFSPDGRIKRYTAKLCRQNDCRVIWLCVTRAVGIAGRH